MKLKSLLKKNTRIPVMILILLVALVLPQVINRPYIVAIMVLTVYTASASLAWSILGGMIGQISLGHAAFAGLGAYIGTVLYCNYNVSPWISMLVAFVVAGTLMMLLMSPCFGLKGAYFSLATIAFGEAFRNLFTNWEYVGSGQGMILSLVKKDSLLMIAFKDKTSYYYVGLFLLVLFYVIVKLIDNSKLGYAFKTIREDEGTANAIGINPLRYKMIATFISCGMVAAIGVFYACYVRYINPDVMTQSQSLALVLPAVIGGIATVEGPVLGAIIIVPLSQYLSSALGSVLPGSNWIIYAAILIAVVLFQPAGIIGWFKARRQKKLISIESRELHGGTPEISKEAKGV